MCCPSASANEVVKMIDSFDCRPQDEEPEEQRQQPPERRREARASPEPVRRPTGGSCWLLNSHLAEVAAAAASATDEQPPRGPTNFLQLKRLVISSPSRQQLIRSQHQLHGPSLGRPAAMATLRVEGRVRAEIAKSSSSCRLSNQSTLTAVSLALADKLRSSDDSDNSVGAEPLPSLARTASTGALRPPEGQVRPFKGATNDDDDDEHHHEQQRRASRRRRRRRQSERRPLGDSTATLYVAASSGSTATAASSARHSRASSSSRNELSGHLHLQQHRFSFWDSLAEASLPSGEQHLSHYDYSINANAHTNNNNNSDLNSNSNSISQQAANRPTCLLAPPNNPNLQQQTWLHSRKR